MLLACCWYRIMYRAVLMHTRGYYLVSHSTGYRRKRTSSDHRQRMHCATFQLNFNRIVIMFPHTYSTRTTLADRLNRCLRRSLQNILIRTGQQVSDCSIAGFCWKNCRRNRANLINQFCPSRLNGFVQLDLKRFGLTRACFDHASESILMTCCK